MEAMIMTAEKPQHDFRMILSKKLENRRVTNPAFSIRAFARQLQISHTLLSNVLSGKKGVSLDLAQRLCERMMLDEEESRKFLALVLLESASSETLKNMLLEILSGSTKTL